MKTVKETGIVINYDAKKTNTIIMNKPMHDGK
jgi:hypothetical protein